MKVFDAVFYRLVDKPLHVMQTTILTAYKEFCIEYPNIKIGMFTFQKARPSCVHLLRKMKWLQCVCDLCANIKYIAVAIHSSLMRNDYESPDWLPADNAIALGLATLCAGSEKFSDKCLSRTCDECGGQHLLDDLVTWSNDDLSDTMRWKEWCAENEVVKKKVVKRVKLAVKSGLGWKS